jgi:hypothetical protein
MPALGRHGGLEERHHHENGDGGRDAEFDRALEGDREQLHGCLE